MWRVESGESVSQQSVVSGCSRCEDGPHSRPHSHSRLLQVPHSHSHLSLTPLTPADTMKSKELVLPRNVPPENFQSNWTLYTHKRWARAHVHTGSRRSKHCTGLLWPLLTVPKQWARAMKLRGVSWNFLSSFVFGHELPLLLAGLQMFWKSKMN